jgi:hypothetical protein
MKSCVVRRRFHTSEASGTAVTVNLKPGFGVPKACLIQYTESSAVTDSFDTTTEYRTLGIGMIGSTDSSVTSTLRYHCVYATMRDNQSASDVRRQNSSTRFAFATDTAGATFWQGTSATFTTDTASFVFASSTPQTNGHLECIMTFFGGDNLKVGIGTHLMPSTAGGATTYTGLTFQPDVVIAASTITAINAGATDDFRFCFGCADRINDRQQSMYFHSEGGAGTMDLATVSSFNRIINYSTSTSAGPFYMRLSQFTSTGFAITSDAAAAGSNNLMIFMALRRETTAGSAQTIFFRLGETFTGGSFTPAFQQRTLNYVGACTAASNTNAFSRASTFGDSIQLFAGEPTTLPPTFSLPGTITTNSASTTVTGSGTFFHRVASGDSLVSVGNTLIGTIASITSNTSLTLTANAAATYPAGTEFGVIRYNHNCINFGDQPNAPDSNVFSGVSNFQDVQFRVAYVSGGAPTFGVGVSNNPTIGALYSDREIQFFGYNPTGLTGNFKSSWILLIGDDENYNTGRRLQLSD